MENEHSRMNLLVTLNRAYLKYLISMLRSFNDSNPYPVDIYIFSNDLSIDDIAAYKTYLSPSNAYHIIRIPKSALVDAPISSRYPTEMYYRIFAGKFLPPQLDKILYLDPDIIVKGDLMELYSMDMKNALFAGACNIRRFLKKFNQIKNSAPKDAEYVNTGVLLMNLRELRKHQNEEEVFSYIEQKKHLLTLPDQDIISALYGEKIILIDKLIYNLSDRTILFHNLHCEPDKKIDLDWVEKNTKIIHYFGRNKPWKENYHGILAPYYEKYKID